MFHVLRSSAGAGKTHALVKHYVGLCLRSPDPAAYRQVLALTFTNKAAQEMRDRTVRYLRDLARQVEHDAALADVQQHLKAVTGMDEDAIALRADRLLRHMLHHWSEVAISTIDAFTQRVVLPFAGDLRFEHDLRMSTDQEGYLKLAVERLIALAGGDPRVTDILGQACLQLLDDEQRWDPETPLLQLSRQLQNERSIAPLQGIAAIDVAEVRRIGNTLRDQQRTYRTQVRELGARALRTLQEAGISPEQLFQTKRGIYGLFMKLACFQDEPLEVNSHARTTLKNGRWAGPNATAAEQATIEVLKPALEALAHEALDLLRNGMRDHLLRGAILRDLPATFALHELEQQLEAVKQEDGIAFFSDLTRRVAEIVATEPVSFIHERMGERYRHFLIDEFQDTSMLQWTCLLPLIDNALASGGSTLLVGDAKQAIYRWRNGEVRLFTTLPRLFGRGDDPLEAEREDTLVRNHAPLPPLAHNRRSSPVIIAFNNLLFGSLAQDLPETLKPVYNAQEQLPGKVRPGLVDLRVVEDDEEGGDRWATVLRYVDDALQQALQDNARPGDVAVLVRTSAQGARIAEHLLAQGLAVLSPDGLKVAVDRRVAMVIDALRALFLGDMAAAVRTLAAQALIVNGTHGDTDPFADRNTAPSALNELRATLLPLPLNDSLAPLGTLLLHVHQRLLPDHVHTAPFLALMDEAHSWSDGHAADVPAFIRHWDRNGAARSTAPPNDGGAVHVMTIHKAKGLEFPVVIVPDASMRSSGRNTEHIWVAPGTATPSLDAALIAYNKKLLDAGVPELIVEHELRHLDDLNLLYVAFTRPVERLHAFVRRSANDPVGKGLLGWIGLQGAPDGYRSGEHAPLQSRNSRTSSGSTLPPRRPLSAAAVQVRTRNDQARSAAVERGRKLHAVLAHVAHTEQLPQALDRCVRQGEIDEADRTHLQTELTTMLASEKLAPWYGTHTNARNEATIVDTEGKAWRPDRVVFDHQAVRVLDLKTGEPRDEHRQQVQHYLHLLRQMGHDNVSGAIYYVLNDEIISV